MIVRTLTMSCDGCFEEMDTSALYAAELRRDAKKAGWHRGWGPMPAGGGRPPIADYCPECWAKKVAS